MMWGEASAHNVRIPRPAGESDSRAYRESGSTKACAPAYECWLVLEK